MRMGLILLTFEHESGNKVVFVDPNGTKRVGKPGGKLGDC